MTYIVLGVRLMVRLLQQKLVILDCLSVCVVDERVTFLVTKLQ